MERRIRRLGIALVALFTLVFGQLAYVQVFAADDIRANPANFSRQLIAEYNVERGKIITTGGLVIAESVPAPEGSRYRYERRYPQGDLYGYITGYYSRIYGRSALEESMNTYLSGEAPELAISTFTDLLLGNEKRGANVFVTIDPNLQEAARAALGSNEGAVVAMDPVTGDILALYSTPGFDPSELSSGSDEEIRRAWKRLNADPEKPLLALSHQELFLPGSSFKIVTASAALENRFGPDSVWPNPHRLTLPLTNEQLQNFGDDHCNGGSSQISHDRGVRGVVQRDVRRGRRSSSVPSDSPQQARAYGLCGTLPPERTTCDEQLVRFELPFENGRFPEPEYFERNDPLLAFSGIGLDNDLVNPAADGADRLRRGERRRDAAAEARDRGPRRAGAGGAGVRRQERGNGDQRRIRGGAHPDDDRGGERGQRVPRADPRDPGRGEDGHRDERRGPRRRTPGSRRSPRRGANRLPGSPSRLSSSTAGTWAVRPPVDRSRHPSFVP